MTFPKCLYVENVTKINYILESYQNYLDFKEAFPEFKNLTWGGKGEKAIFGDCALKHIDKQEAIKELIDFGVMIAWKDIDKIKKYNVEVNSHTYLLNPLLIRRCSARSYKRNCEVTKDKFNNGKVVFIREQDAMVYNFSKMVKLNLPNLENVNLEIEL